MAFSRRLERHCVKSICTKFSSLPHVGARYAEEVGPLNELPEKAMIAAPSGDWIVSKPRKAKSNNGEQTAQFSMKPRISITIRGKREQLRPFFEQDRAPKVVVIEREKSVIYERPTPAPVPQWPSTGDPLSNRPISICKAS